MSEVTKSNLVSSKLNDTKAVKSQTKEVKAENKPVQINSAKNDFGRAVNVIKYPLGTEKAVRLMELSNVLTFVVEKKATKYDIKNSVEKLFKAVVIKVRTYVAPSGEKHAYVTVSKNTPAIDIATNLGMI